MDERDQKAIDNVGTEEVLAHEDAARKHKEDDAPSKMHVMFVDPNDIEGPVAAFERLRDELDPEGAK